MSPLFALAILAGGQSTRMGTDKAFVRLHGKPLIQHVLERVQRAAPAQCFIAANDPAAYAHLNLPVFGDHVRHKGPLAGICAALEAADHDNVLVVACDMPFVSPTLLTLLVDKQCSAPEPYQAIVPRLGERLQGLCALYHRSALPPLRAALDADRLRLADALPTLSLYALDELQYQPLGVEARAFTNINTPDDLRQAQECRA